MAYTDRNVVDPTDPLVACAAWAALADARGEVLSVVMGGVAGVVAGAHIPPRAGLSAPL